MAFLALVDLLMAVFCLPYLLPYGGYIGTIATSGTIGKTWNDICLPLVLVILPMLRTPNARLVVNIYVNLL